MPPGTANITVAVRVRPLSQKEVMRGAFPTLEVHDGRTIDVMDVADSFERRGPRDRRERYVAARARRLPGPARR